MIPKDGLQPGIYFKLPNTVYHADKALSRSDIVNLTDTAFTYWQNSWMNPDRAPKKSTPDMELGDAFHCMLFEPEDFEKRYFVFPTDKWDNGRKMISREDFDMIIECIKVLRRGKDSNLFLSGGMPEVTIVFDAFGFRFRTRHDYLVPFCSVDFKKTFSLSEWHLKSAFGKYGYDVQMYLYKLARTRFREQFLNGEAHVYGKVDAAFFEKFLYDQINDFVFIFQRDSAPYPFEPLAPEDDTEQSGEDKVTAALKLYDINYKKYGTKQWEVSDGKLKRFSMRYGMIREN